MHMILRTLWAFFCKNFLRPIPFNAESNISMRVLPTDLDLLWHVNNGVYFSYMDFGRWDLIFRNGLFDIARKNKIYSVVASESMKFKKSLELWDKFTLKTKVIGKDERYFFINQQFYSSNNELMATGFVKIRFIQSKKGPISPDEVLKLCDGKLPEISQELSKQSYEFEQSFLK